RARLTVSFMPVAPGTSENEKIDVAQWPQRIDALLRRSDWLKLVADPISLSPSKRPTPYAVATAKGKLLDLVYNSPIPPKAQSVQEIQVELAKDALSRSENHASTNISAFWEQLAAIFTTETDDPAYTSGQSIPNVVPTGRGDAAVAFVLARTARLTERLREPD